MVRIDDLTPIIPVLKDTGDLLYDTKAYQTPSAVAGAGIDFNADGTIGTTASAPGFYIVRASSSDVIAPSVNDWKLISIKAGRIGGISAVSGDDDILIPPAVEPYIAEDITIDELEDLDIRGNNGDCTIKSVTPTVFFAGVEGQKMTVTVRNLFSTATSADVTLSLKGESSDVSCSVPASGNAAAEFTVSSSLEAGIYQAEIRLACANGRTEDKTVYITVTSADPITLVEGESKDVEGDAFTAYVAVVDDESVAAISGGKIYGLKAGDTFISFCENSEKVVASIPVKVTEKAAPVIAPTIITSSIPSADEGVSYDVSFAAMGTAPIKWTVIPDVSEYGLKFTESGDLSGVPSKAGTLTFIVTAQNTAGSDSAKFTIQVIAKPVLPMITTDSLDLATEGESYDAQLTATGTAPIQWTWSGAIPAGLALSADSGRITGIPTTPGDYTFTVAARNVAGSVARVFNLTVQKVGGKGEPPSIITEDLRNVKAGDPYNFQLEASGTGPLSWSAVFPTALKKELSISDKGLITGTPSTAGSYMIVVTVKNGSGTDSKSFMLSVYSETLKAPTVATKKLPDAFLNTEYNYRLEASDGLPELWRITKGELPKGLELDENTGEISGLVTTTKATTFSFTVVASNDAGASKPKTLKLKVIGKDDIGFKTDVLKAAKFGSNYSMTIKLKNFKATVWSIAGDLPEGITFDTTKGKLSGKPKEVDDFDFTVTASNGAVEIAQDFKLVVNGIPPKFKKSSFTTGYEGMEYSCTLKAAGTTPITWEFSELPDGLNYSPDVTGENCTIYGVPTKAFSDKIAVTITNGKTDEDSLTKNIKLTIKAVKPTFNKKVPPVEGFVDENYYFEFELSKKPVELDWEYSGELPEGITFEDGVLVGNPEESGTFKFAVTVRNANKTSDKATWSISIRIEPARSDVPDIKGDQPEPEPEPTPESKFENGVAYYERGELTADMTARVANNGEIIAAILPAIEVEEAQLYEFTVSLDVSVPVGATLVWHSFPDGEEADSEEAFFLNDEDEIIETVPETYSVTVSAWLEPGVVYEPVIAVKIRD